jgi:plasmid stability protein
MIQIRNVPADLHRKLKARAALEGMTLSDYLLQEIRRSAELPSREEIAQRLKGLAPLGVRESGAETVRAVRRERGLRIAKTAAPRAFRSVRARR